MTAYDVEAWTEFFLGVAGAVAALSGLIFVGVSVNLPKILEAEKVEGGSFLTGRAIEALVALLSVLGIATFGLAPDLGHVAFSVVLLTGAVFCVIAPVRLVMVVIRTKHRPAGFVSRLAFATALVACLIAGGISLLAGVGGGLYWLPFAVVAAVTVAAVNAWVLLVEVMR
ncbi:hypothetical protein [Glaciihabitans sp. dw_435]|uniref:hypothetical protein n=1 Tax=Glaciihabitans sp. dw_435 TaxID=2720081 RepID=UPI001BD603B1|nr:hypothetical protein [Glaciihabitans sp. dw_435]